MNVGLSNKKKIGVINTNFNEFDLRERIIKLALLQIDKEYRHGSFGANTFDCAGFVWYIYYEILKIDIFNGGYGLSTTTKIMTSNYGKNILFEEGNINKDLNIIKVGDILFFHRQSMNATTPKQNNKYPGHCGIYLKDNYFIHCSRSKGKVVIDNFDKDEYWKKVLVGTKDIVSEYEEKSFRGGLIMKNYEKIENDFYGYRHNILKSSNNDVNLMWDKIKQDKDLLRWAIKPIKNKYENDMINGLAICDAMLIDYENVDKDIYQELINLIYSNKNIARIVQHGYSNGGRSYLLMSLWNFKLKLTEKQKEFAVSEAMNKIGTTRYRKIEEDYSKSLEEKGITDDITTTIDIDGSANPIGAKTKNEYMNYVFNSLSDSQAHGRGEFDIRYWILRNPNWSLQEKQKLIMDFYSDDEVYDETLDQWEWGIINDNCNYKNNNLGILDKCEIYNYSYEDLLNFYGDKKIADRIYEEINFCKQMHKLRPKQWELEYDKPIVLEKTNVKR